MRLLGIVLVLVGALALGVRGFGSESRGSGEAARPTGEAGWVPPAVAGIAVVGGLLLLAGDGKRE
ncbi:MAG: hypothetical protein K2X87_23620 [Gemmataceae bacterium]|nr:hypothetical protein [Gemmataceae bacterium]